MTINSIVNAAEKKFQGDFVKTQFVEQLGYFDDVTVAPIEFIHHPYSTNEIQSYLGRQVAEYLKTILPETK